MTGLDPAGRLSYQFSERTTHHGWPMARHPGLGMEATADLSSGRGRSWPLAGRPFNCSCSGRFRKGLAGQSVNPH